MTESNVLELRIYNDLAKKQLMFIGLVDEIIQDSVEGFPLFEFANHDSYFLDDLRVNQKLSEISFTMKMPGSINLADNFEVTLDSLVTLDTTTDYSGVFDPLQSLSLNCFINQIKVRQYYFMFTNIKKISFISDFR